MGDYQNKRTDSVKVREKLDHPVIDGDGHIIESRFVLPDFLNQIGGPDLAERFQKEMATARPGRPKNLFWSAHTGKGTIDRVTTMLPRLYAQRIEEAGIDFCTLYSTMGFRVQTLHDDELRQAGCRALNMMYADMFKDVSDKMTPSALIPMVTPEEAVAELEFACGELGLKSAFIAGEVLRPIPAVEAVAPQLNDSVRHYTSIGLDSPYDYDPFWAKCVELKVAPATHAFNFTGTHASPTSYLYNRLGYFATSGFAAARSLFISGVTRRFPDLNIGFLEGGVWWGVALYNDLVEFWEKRNVDALLERHDPANVDLGLMEEMYRRYGNDYMTAERFMENKDFFTRDGRTSPGEVPDFVDEWKNLDMEKAEDLLELYIKPFYFGCEADDAMNYTAFNSKANAFGAKLKAMFSSDLGHWDVVDFGEVLEETHEAVDRGLMSDEDFKDFVFTNPATYMTRMNPDYFKGTCVEAEVAKMIKETGEAA
ncbi:MAG: amidohydrolase family protein [Rhodospirillaceae bacterium]|jgi:predicted TIM-barrel fold metal-dependent hydrolase|nr:amidohydrolase family protein [Rhodospirillaceae bacterium]MBT4115695.1 amidohydrolase family protein [Rhodospirillaceae bacterium]MBT4673410.1 amidohydrolase family protein [Rhodospirillaceae bacterium]MBT4750051.1 amidohydrolase family protein [Rhodospirillaceae bacterium]MBT5181153.1 amidohydrolase family protein [Rhodospirillaceae bacterium]